MATMIAPAPYFQVQAPSATYTADAAGVITGVATNDILALRGAGCEQVGVAGALTMLARLLNANMNVTTDQALTTFTGSMPFRITKVTAKNASVSLTTAQGGIYTAAAKGGTAIMATTAVFTTATGPTLAADIAIVATPGNTIWPAGTPLILSLTTAQGAAATCDLFVFGDLGQ